MGSKLVFQTSTSVVCKAIEGRSPFGYHLKNLSSSLVNLQKLKEVSVLKRHHLYDSTEERKDFYR